MLLEDRRRFRFRNVQWRSRSLNASAKADPEDDKHSALDEAVGFLSKLLKKGSVKKGPVKSSVMDIDVGFSDILVGNSPFNVLIDAYS